MILGGQPGTTTAFDMAQDMAAFGFDASAGAPPDVIGVVVAWLADGHAAEWAGGVVPGQQLCHDHGLLPGWPGPVANPV